MTLEEIEQLAREFIAASNDSNARTFKAFDERDDPRLARFVLAAIPVLKVAEVFRRTYPQTDAARNLAVELVQALDTMRAAMKEQ